MHNSFFWPLPHFTKFVLSLYFKAMVFLTAMRIFLLMYVPESPFSLLDSLTRQALYIGFQFDTVVLSYILALPIVFLYIQSTIFARKKYIPYIVTFFLSIVFPILVLMVVADIPYFEFFKNRLSESSLQWMGALPIVFIMIAANTAHLIFLIVGLVLFFSTGYLVYRYCKRKLIDYNWEKNKSDSQYVIIFLILILTCLCFFGMRGKLEHPIRQGDAFYCEDPILNQAGLNPAFTMLKSYSNKVTLMEENLAISNIQKMLLIDQPIHYVSPIAREVKGKSSRQNYNVVLVLMEGMSADYMGTFGNKEKLTPTLDSLAKKSWFFPNAYSAGIHTNNGIFSSLFSFPALKRIRPMSTVPARTYSGLPYTLKQFGYKNLFFSPHAGIFDNMNVFLPANFIDSLYTSDIYPKEKILGPFGVPDDYLFSYAVNELDHLDAGKPFFATILTVSNHGPYVLPSYYKPLFKDKSKSAVSYADWSIKQFLNQVQTKPWFKNTLFVFVSDHGLPIGESVYDLSLSYNHVPIILYAPEILGEPRSIPNFMGQIDIFPTLMGILNVDYINNTLGVDALTHKRESIYFSADDKVGCINEDWLYVYRYNGGESLYQYKTNSREDFSQKEPDVMARLKEFCFSQIQVADYMFRNDKTRIPQKEEGKVAGK